jgi:hypothetical protein
MPLPVLAAACHFWKLACAHKNKYAQHKPNLESVKSMTIFDFIALSFSYEVIILGVR